MEKIENTHDVFSLEVLMRKLEDIRDGNGSDINMAKALYTLAFQIRALKIALCTSENAETILNHILTK